MIVEDATVEGRGPALIRERRGVNRRRRARSAVLAAAGALVGLNLGLAAALDQWPELRDPRYYHQADHFRARRVEAGGRAVTVAFVGSSRTGDGVRPVLVEELVVRETGRPCVAHNLVVPGTGAIGELLLWNRLLDRGLRPDVVAVEITPLKFLTVDGQPPDPVAWSGGRMTRSELRVVRTYGFPADVEAEWREDNWNPWFGFRFQLLGWARSKWLPPRTLHVQRLPTANLGWTGALTANCVPERWQAAVDRQWPQLMAAIELARFDGPSAQAIRDLIRSAIARGTAVAVWVTPEAAALRASYPTRVDAALADFLAELRAAGAVAVDGRAWLPDQAFWDGHHPVRDWVPEYTRRVTEEAVLPAAARCPTSARP